MDEPTQSRENDGRKQRPAAVEQLPRSEASRSAQQQGTRDPKPAAIPASTAGPSASAARDSSSTNRAEQSRGLTESVRERASAQLATRKDVVADGIHTVADAVRRTTQQLREAKQEGLADYVGRGAEQLERLSEGLKGKELGDLVRDAQGFARRRPAIFIGSAFALGLLTARFLKSSPAISGGTTPQWQRPEAMPPASLDPEMR